MPYLTVAEYVRRFGQRETIQLTNEQAASPGVAPQIDEVKVEEALTDATDIVDSYAAKRYATPMQSVPTIVRGWTAALARHKLATQTGRVNDAIKDESDRTYRQLESLAAGKLDLPIPEGSAAPAPVSPGNAQSSGDRTPSLFGGGILDSYTAPILGGSPLPCWRQGT